MPLSDADFRTAVIRLLAAVSILPQEELKALTSPDCETATIAAFRVIGTLARPTRVVVHLSAGANPVDCFSDRPLDILELRRGHDLANFYQDETQYFFVRDDEGSLTEVVGDRRGVLVTPSCVAGAFASYAHHRAHTEFLNKVASAQAEDRRFKIEWLEGYDETAPEVHPLTWITPELGFAPESVDALLQLDIGFSHDVVGAMDRVRMTRVA